MNSNTTTATIDRSIPLKSIAKPMPIVVVCLGMAVPTLITWIYFDLLTTAPAIAQKIAYAAGKFSQVGIMLLAYWIWMSLNSVRKG